MALQLPNERNISVEYLGQVLPFKVVSNYGGGDCLFRAVAQFRHNDEGRHLEIRDDIVDYCQSAHFDLDFYGAIFADHGSIDNYIRRLTNRRRVLWGTAMEINLLHRVYGYYFQVFRKVTNEFAVFHQHTDVDIPAQVTVRLLFSGPVDAGHYELLIPEIDDFAGNLDNPQPLPPSPEPFLDSSSESVPPAPESESESVSCPSSKSWTKTPSDSSTPSLPCPRSRNKVRDEKRFKRREYDRKSSSSESEIDPKRRRSERIGSKQTEKTDELGDENSWKKYLGHDYDKISSHSILNVMSAIARQYLHERSNADSNYPSEIDDFSDTYFSDTQYEGVSSSSKLSHEIDTSSECEMDELLHLVTAEREGVWRIPPHALTARPSVVCCHDGKRGQYYKFAQLFGSEDVEAIHTVSLPPLDWKCPHCGALFRKTEITFNRNPRVKDFQTAKCCQLGKISLPEGGNFQKPPPEIERLFIGDDEEAKHFRDHIVSYNYLFQMAFPSGNIKSQEGKGSVCYFADGTVRYFNTAFRDGSGGPDIRTQYFFVEESRETSLARQMTSSKGKDLRLHIIEKLEKFFRLENPFIQNFTFAAEIARREEQNALREGRPVKEIILAINPKPFGLPSVRYVTKNYRNFVLDSTFHLPENEYMAAVFCDDLKGISYDCRFYPRTMTAEDISPPSLNVDSPTIDMMTYPLIHLFAEKSWGTSVNELRIQRNYHKGMEIDGDAVCSLREYYAYRIQKRLESENDFNTLNLAGRLKLQYLIDAAIKIEYSKLGFYERKQKELRMEKLSVLKMRVERRVRHVFPSAPPCGKLVLMPASHPKANNARVNAFLNAMTLTQELGLPSWFITMTANPNWESVQAELNGRPWEEHPEILVRHFLQYLLSLLDDLITKQALGRVIGYNVRIEFQKRGVIHAHIILIMHPDDVPRSATEWDRFVSVQVPDPKTCPRAFKLVTTHMTHGPCDRQGNAKRPAPCRVKDNKCRFGAPWKFTERTKISGSKVELKRPASGPTFRKGRRILDARWTSAYNLPLLLRYNCHLNVQPCTSIMAIKYLHMYMNKGPDRACVSIAEKVAKNLTPGQPFEWNEIEHFKEMRYFGVHEAIMTIMGESLNLMSHTIYTLPVHLPDQQEILFEEDFEEEALIERGGMTKLTAYFELNKQEHPNRQNCFYNQTPKTHTWHPKERVWKHRKSRKDTTLGRINNVQPTMANDERYYLRLLLLNVPGATSFEHLRTVNGVLCATFKQACIELGLLENDREPHRAMDELVRYAPPRSIRLTFALILLFLRPLDPQSLFDKYAEDICEDYLKREKTDQLLPHHKAMALYEIEIILKEHGQTLESCNLIAPAMTLQEAEILRDQCEELDRRNAQSTRELSSIQIQERAIEMRACIDQDLYQRRAFVSIWDALMGKNDKKAFYLQGVGGCGKTFFFNALIFNALACGKNVLPTAYTGIAATLLYSGVTSHKAFGLPVEIDWENLDSLTSSLRAQQDEAQRLINADLIIWDEVSMAAHFQLEILDYVLRKFCGSDLQFAGKVVVFGGDFHQCLPVVRGGTRSSVIRASIISHPIWKTLTVFKLENNMRAGPDETRFASWLLKVGDGSINDVDAPHTITLKDQEVLARSRDELIDFVFGESAGEETRQNAILCPTNRAAEEINIAVLDKIQAGGKTYLSQTYLSDKEGCALSNENHDINRFFVPQEFLESLSVGGLPPHRLFVKKGCVVMLLRNLNMDTGLCNGTRMVVVNHFENILQCKILSGVHAGDDVYIPRITLSSNEYNLPGHLCRRQFPIKLAHAMTINKSQGQTLSKCGLYLSTPCFSHGQLYVACSRVRSKKDLKIFVTSCGDQWVKTRNQRMTAVTMNVVYKEILNAIARLT